MTNGTGPAVTWPSARHGGVAQVFKELITQRNCMKPTKLHHQPELHGILMGGAQVPARNPTLSAVVSPLVLMVPIFPLAMNLIQLAQSWGA